MNYGEKKLLNDDIINPIPILQSSFLNHQSTLDNQGTTIAKLSPRFSFLHPPTSTLISMDVTMTSFHTPYSCWPPSRVATNENHYNFHVNGSQTIYFLFFKLLHKCRQNY
jgi:hypothetical protein